MRCHTATHSVAAPASRSCRLVLLCPAAEGQHTFCAGSAAFSFLSWCGNLPPCFFLIAHSPRRWYVLLRPCAPMPRTSSATIFPAHALLPSSPASLAVRQAGSSRSWPCGGRPWSGFPCGAQPFLLQLASSLEPSSTSQLSAVSRELASSSVEQACALIWPVKGAHRRS